jgi:hypothetical protein
MTRNPGHGGILISKKTTEDVAQNRMNSFPLATTTILGQSFLARILHEFAR